VIRRILTAATVLLVPSIAAACPVCAAGTNRGVSTLTTIACMIAIPYVVGLVAYKVIRRTDAMTQLVEPADKEAAKP
jgi:hypothetical protein